MAGSRSSGRDHSGLLVVFGCGVVPVVCLVRRLQFRDTDVFWWSGRLVEYWSQGEKKEEGEKVWSKK